jgi:2-keto-4-pentenoate hydratase
MIGYLLKRACTRSRTSPSAPAPATDLRLAAHGIGLEPRQIILSGSFTRPVHACAGDTFHADYGALGTIAWRFV